MTSESTTIGPYQLHEKLGSHRRHHVYRATHRETAKVVAIKLVKITSKIERSTAIKKLQLEVKILRRLDHPRLVRTLDAGVVDDQMFIVMERVEGESLAAILSRRGRLPWDLAVDYARQIAEGLDYLHKQDLVHLKLNPEKVIVQPDGTIKLADLRLNRARKRRWDETKRRVLDIAAYMAPEQMTDEGGVARSDIYTVGVLLFEMICGVLPHEPDTLQKIIRAKQQQVAPRVSSLQVDVPVWLDNLIAEMLAAKQTDRPHSSYALLVSLREVQRMHAEGRSYAEELTRGFNPLTAGKDKSEAYRLLGKKENKAPRERDFRYQIPIIGLGFFLSVALTSALLWWALRPPSEEWLYARAKDSYAVEEVSERSLLRAKRHLEPLVERFPDGQHAEQAKSMLDDVRAQLAERRMKRRYRRGIDAKEDAEKLAVQAWQLEELGDRKKAVELYQELLDLKPVEDEDELEDFNDFQALARQQIARLEEELQLEEENPETRRANLSERLAQAASLESDRKLVESRKILRNIIDSFDGDEEVQDLVDEAKQRLDGLQDPSSEQGESESTGETEANSTDENAETRSESPEGSR